MIPSVLAGLVLTFGAVSIDWSSGQMDVRAGGAPSLRAPNPAIARVGAERIARRRAAKQLIGAMAALPVLGGGTVASRMSHSSAVRARVQALASEARIVTTEYASDGGIEIVARIALDEIAQALEGRESRPPADTRDAGATSQEPATGGIIFVVDKLKPVVVPGGEVRFFESLDQAKLDNRLGKDAPVRTVKRLREADLQGQRAAVVVEGGG